MRRRRLCSLVLAASVAFATPAASWTTEGIVVTNYYAGARNAALAPDGASGLLVGVSGRPTNNSQEWLIRTSRVTTDGTKLWSWSPGVHIMAPDGAGGAFGLRVNGTELRLFHALPNGSDDPLYGGSNGILAATTPNESFNAKIVSDDSGGAYLLTSDAQEVTVWRYTQGALASGWPETGVPVSSSITPGPMQTESAEDVLIVQAVPDGAHGVIILSIIGNTLRTMRVLPDGSPSWSTAPVNDPALAGPVLQLMRVGDSFFSCWFNNLGEIRLQRQSVTTGGRRLGWPINGVVVAQGPIDSLNAMLASDGSDNMYVAWSFASRLRGTRITGTGALAPGWPVEGINLLPDGAMPALSSIYPIYSVAMNFVVAANYDRLITCWTDVHDPNQPIVLARWLQPDGTPDPAQPGSGRPVSPRLGPGGRVLGAMGDGNRGAYVCWSDITPSGFAQSVGWLSYWTPWVGVFDPLPPEISVRAWPNPARDVLQVEFAAASDSPAMVELLDVAGHRVRSLESRASGTRMVRLDRLERLPTGVYFLRVTQGPSTRTLRLALVR